MNNNYLPLNNKVTLVTGAAGGIGRAICYEFARLGSTVCMCDISDTTELANEIEINCKSTRPVPILCDISSLEQVKEMICKINKDLDGVDILINNAAVNTADGITSFPEMTEKGFRKTIDIDLSAAVWMTLLVLPYMKDRNNGRILFTAAPRSSSGIPAPYLAGKSGFMSMAKYLHSEYKKYGIRTLALSLRHTETPMIRRVIASKGIDVEEGLKKMNAKSLTGRMITPDEIAKFYAWFAIAGNSEVSSVSLLFDGGITYLR